jgi:hypothetical protein
MKANDKAIDAALAEGKLWCEGVQFDLPNQPIWKVLRVTNKNGNYKTIKKFNNREERDEALNRLRVKAMINAAFDALEGAKDKSGAENE